MGMYLLSLVVTLVILGLLMWLFIWFIGWAGIPDPFSKVAMVLVGLFAFIYLAMLLMGYAQPLPILGHFLGGGHG